MPPANGIRQSKGKGKGKLYLARAAHSAMRLISRGALD